MVACTHGPRAVPTFMLEQGLMPSQRAPGIVEYDRLCVLALGFTDIKIA